MIVSLNYLKNKNYPYIYSYNNQTQSLQADANKDLLLTNIINNNVYNFLLSLFGVSFTKSFISGIYTLDVLKTYGQITTGNVQYRNLLYGEDFIINDINYTWKGLIYTNKYLYSDKRIAYPYEITTSNEYNYLGSLIADYIALIYFKENKIQKITPSGNINRVSGKEDDEKIRQELVYKKMLNDLSCMIYKEDDDVILSLYNYIILKNEQDNSFFTDVCLNKQYIE